MKNVLQISRRATVEVVSESGKSKGTGFLVGRRHVVTCFHVIACLESEGDQFKWMLYPELKLKFFSGLIVTGKVVSIPSSQSPEPLLSDFAVIELLTEVPPELTDAALKIAEPKFEIGDDVFFSGYPLATPAMVSHKGMISGYSESLKILCIQGAINKGNSGGALCNDRGEVIGIVSMREGGISAGLIKLNAHIEQTSKHGVVAIMGVDPLQAIKAVSQTLDQYISTGIGYAHSTEALRIYLSSRPELLK